MQRYTNAINTLLPWQFSVVLEANNSREADIPIFKQQSSPNRQTKVKEQKATLASAMRIRISMKNVGQHSYNNTRSARTQLVYEHIFVRRSSTVWLVRRFVDSFLLLQ